MGNSCENMQTFVGESHFTDNTLVNDSKNSHPSEVTSRPKEMSVEQLVQVAVAFDV